MTTNDVVRVRHDVVRRRTTSYMTYDVVRTMSYVYILYIARTTSHVRYTTRCRMSHVRCLRHARTYVRHSRWQESKWYMLHHDTQAGAKKISYIRITYKLYMVYTDYILNMIIIYVTYNYIQLHTVTYYRDILITYGLHTNYI